MTFENKELSFMVRGTSVTIEAVPKDVFDKAWFYEVAQYGKEEEYDRYFFEYKLAVGYAISKYVGYKVHVISSTMDNAAFEAVDSYGNFIGIFTVYSQYVGLSSIYATIQDCNIK